MVNIRKIFAVFFAAALLPTVSFGEQERAQACKDGGGKWVATLGGRRVGGDTPSTTHECKCDDNYRWNGRKSECELTAAGRTAERREDCDKADGAKWSSILRRCQCDDNAKAWDDEGKACVAKAGAGETKPDYSNEEKEFEAAIQKLVAAYKTRIAGL